MKTTKIIFTLLFIAGIALLFNTGCDEPNEDTSPPRFVSAKVVNDASDEVVVIFSKDLYTSVNGFTITVDDVIADIIDIVGSGNTRITFILDEAIQYGQEVYIEYEDSEGNAEDKDGYHLRSFSKREVNNYVEKLNLSVYLPTIPPEMKDERVWLILRTDEDSDDWANAHATARVNEVLTAEPTKTPYDLIIHLTSDPEWRPHMPFDSGYYATLLNLQTESIHYEVISWVKEDGLKGTDMGYLIDANNDEENDSFDKAYVLSTDGKDYLESKIYGSHTLWFKFSSDLGSEYTITINDNYNEPNNFTGIIEGVIMDKYRIPFEDVPSVISGYPITIDGNDEDILIEVKVADRGGKDGSFQIQVVKE